jgi:uncharacterized membrane protein YgcG
MKTNVTKRTIGVVNITTRGELILTLTNEHGRLSRTRWTSLQSLVENIQNIGWYGHSQNSLVDIPDDPTGATFAQGEKVVQALTIYASDQFAPQVGQTFLPSMIVHSGTDVVVMAGVNNIALMAGFVETVCSGVLTTISSGSGGNTTVGQTGGGSQGGGGSSQGGGGTAQSGPQQN